MCFGFADEFRYFLSVHTELLSALRAGDVAAARTALEELEGIHCCTEWPRLQVRCREALRQYGAVALDRSQTKPFKPMIISIDDETDIEEAYNSLTSMRGRAG